MYLCGHPGTGKTSTLHLVLSNMKTNTNKVNLFNNLDIMLYNAMTFRDVKKFCFKLLADLTMNLTGEDID
jgi:Cdc6-like AAA superfamily ATPase